MVEKSILADKPEILIKKFYKLLIKKGVPVEKMILFGSWAKGRPKYYSDLDVCVVSKIFGRDPYSEMVNLQIIASDIEPMIEPHPYNLKDLHDPWDPLACEILRYGKVIQ